MASARSSARVARSSKATRAPKTTRTPKASRREGLQRVSVFGTGRAGCALLRSLEAAGISVVVVGNRSSPRYSPKGAKRVRGLTATVRAAVAAHADVLFIAVPDDALVALARQLAKQTALPPLVVHLSGARGPDVLEPAHLLAEAAAFHPLAALSEDAPFPPETVVGVSANKASTARDLQSLALRLGCRGVRVQEGAHAGYHLGAALAANLPLALLAHATRLLQDAGVDEDEALFAAVGLMRSAVDQAEKLSRRGRHDLGEVLTGPLARGDVSTLRRHLEVLEQRGDPSLEAAYRALSQTLVDVAKHPAAKKKRLRRVLEGTDPEGTPPR